MKKIFFIILIIIAAVFVYNFTLDSEEPESREIPKNPNVVESGEVMDEVIEEPVIEEPDSDQTPLISDLEKETALLLAVDGSGSEGIGYRQVIDGKLMHSVEADLPVPLGGNVYEGWLVQPSPLEFFSTGDLELNEEGMWFLNYSAEGEFPTYTRVVITEETVVDATPEKHIIEGDFE